MGEGPVADTAEQWDERAILAEPAQRRNEHARVLALRGARS
jgi:hypothetical protein